MASTQRFALSESELTLQVNRQQQRLRVRHHWTLLGVLRDQLDLTGAKRGFDRGAGFRDAVTIEGLAGDGRLDPVRQCFLDNDGGQCGFCTLGFVLSVKALLDANADPSDQDIRQALAGNLCRCNAYGRILQSVREAAAQQRQR